MRLKGRILEYINLGKRVLKTRDGKTLAENFTYLSILQVAGYILPFITLPYLSHVVGVNGFGKLAFASAIIVWVQTIVDWGFGLSATRDVAKNQKDNKQLSAIYSNVFWSRLFLAVLCFMVLCLLIWIIPLFRQHAVVILFTFLLVPGHILFPDYFFLGMEHMKVSTIFNLCIKFAFTIAVFFVINHAEDYIYQPLLTSIGYFIAGIISYIYIKRKWDVSIHRPRFKFIFKSLKDSFDIFIGNFFPTMYNNLSAVILSAIGGPIATGLYDGGNKFVGAVQQFISIIGRVFYPFLNRRPDKHSTYARVNLLLAGMASMALFAFAPLIIHIFLTPDFEKSVAVLRIMSISIFFLSFSSVYCVNYLYVKGFDGQARNITIISSIFGFIMAYPMIRHFSYLGAAINVTMTRGVMGLLYFIVAKKHMKYD